MASTFNPDANLSWDAELRFKRTAPKARPATATAAPAASTGQLRNGAGVPIVGKRTNTASVDHRHAARVDREEEDFHRKVIPLDVGRAIMKARQDKGLTQKDLATKICEKSTVITDYEAGRAAPNQQVLAKLERALGVKLRGKDIGQPLAPRGSAAKKA
ncbi:multiprotein-bridging factor 1 [Blastocladiella emersonii ATCC 22665]|nr:multiprotein-bridging factor 1 [Blastocladiella emersonii ATCC 22665]